MEKAQGFVENGNLVVTVGGVSAAQKAQGSYPQATVSVYNTGTLVLATIYADNSLTPKANPFTAATNGYCRIRPVERCRLQFHSSDPWRQPDYWL
jgi:hypothetical protein